MRSAAGAATVAPLSNCPRAGSSAVERWFYTPDVAGSSPVPPTRTNLMRIWASRATATRLSYTPFVRPASLAAFSLALHAFACGGTSTHKNTGGADAGGGSAGASASGGTGGACPDPVSELPDTAPFTPPTGVLSTFQVTFVNRCVNTVWPAWGSAGGLDNSVIDTQLWSPLSPSRTRTVVVYGGVRDVGFWARTGCRFDESGAGACLTGDCSGFVCPTSTNFFPANATVFVLKQGFLGGYNVGVHVAGTACGNHECVADVGSCAAASAVKDTCGATVACSDICSDEAPECCSGSGARCDTDEFERDASSSGDLLITFCP